ncbi:MAG: ATP-binding protein [Actinomycetota bacterium]|nr:ATP-binding protein [Actinomycetota bacterium]
MPGADPDRVRDINRTLVRRAPVGLLCVDDEVVVDANEAFCSIVRRQRHEIIGVDPFTFFAPRDATALASVLAPDADDREVVVYARRADGVPCQMTVTGSGHDSGPKVLAVRASGPQIVRPEDMTVEQDIGRRELDAALSHDVSAPFRHVSGFLELASEEPDLTDRARRHMTKAIGAARTGALMIERLVQSIRLSQRTYAMTPVDLGDVVQEATRLVHQTGVEVDVVPEALPTVVADDASLIQLFYELIDNVGLFGAGEDGAVATIGARPLGRGWYEVSVSDAGPGMHTLAPFSAGLFRQLQPRGEAPGVGMGLVVAERVAAVHGGLFRIGPGATKGTTVSFRVLGPDAGDDDASAAFDLSSVG